MVQNVWTQYVEFDTTNVLFICSGAFVGLEKQVNTKANKKNIDPNKQLKSPVKKDTWQHKVEHDDLISYGLIPELVGRLPKYSSLELDPI